MTVVTWVASGLSLRTTGIERFAVSLANELLNHRLLAPGDFTVFADTRAVWTTELTSIGINRILPAPGRLTRVPRLLPETRLVHNLGGALFPNPDVSSALRLYSVYDWGPFRDRSMSFRSRVAWGQAIARGLREADVVHYLNPQLADNRPRGLAVPRRVVMAFSASALASVRESWTLPPAALPAYALFIGTNSPRKRVGKIVEMAARTQTPVVLVGDGTEVHAGQPFVRAVGRVDDTQLSALIDSSSALMLISEYEGFGIPVLEAASRGIVSVVSPEVLANLPAGLAEHVVVADVSDDLALGRSIRVAGDSRGMSRFDGSKLLEPLLAVYADALGSV